jgi:hypothetical protein
MSAKSMLIVAAIHANADAEGNAYRVYVDHDLMTERTFAWAPRKVYIEEHITVSLEPGQHNVRVESCKNKGDFIMKSITVNGIPSKQTFNI